MKQFVLDGRNMLERFLESVGQCLRRLEVGDKVRKIEQVVRFQLALFNVDKRTNVCKNPCNYSDK